MKGSALTKIHNHTANFLRSHGLAIGIVLAGIILRLKHYLDNRSFWLDESIAAVSIFHRTYEQIWNYEYIFPYIARPPVFFSMIVKTFGNIFGNNELALRLFPLLCGLGALIIFYRILRKNYDASTTNIALLFFAFSGPLIYYAGELKQYSTDMLIGLLLYAGFEYISRREITWRSALTVGVVGAGVIWLSNAMMFVLAGLGLVLWIDRIIQQKWNEFLRLNLSYLAWIISFLLLYKIVLHHMTTNQELLDCFPNGFCPLPYEASTTWTWIQERLAHMFRSPIGITKTSWAIGLALIGLINLWRQHWMRACALALPILITLLAAILHKYPFEGRLLLFLAPAAIILIAQGILAFSRVSKILPWLTTLLTLFLIAGPVNESIRYLKEKRYHHPNRHLLVEQFIPNYQPGDFILMSPFARPSFWYYTGSLQMLDQLKPVAIPDNILPEKGKLTGLNTGNIAPYVEEKDGIEFMFLREDLALFNPKGLLVGTIRNPFRPKINTWSKGRAINIAPQYKRVWLYLSSIAPDDKKRDELLLYNLGLSGKKILEDKRLQTELYLFDLHQPPDIKSSE